MLCARLGDDQFPLSLYLLRNEYSFTEIYCKSEIPRRSSVLFYSRSKFCNDDVLKIDFYFRHFYIHEFVRISTYSPVRMNGFVVQVIFPFVSALLVLNDSIA